MTTAVLAGKVTIAAEAAAELVVAASSNSSRKCILESFLRYCGRFKKAGRKNRIRRYLGASAGE